MTASAGRLVPLTLLLVAGCGFSNALYNAHLRLGDADRAAARGDTVAARVAYLDAIEKAAKRYREDPAARGAGEALYLIGRGRQGLHEFAAAAAAHRRVLEVSREAALRARAHAALGGALVDLGDAEAARPHLDSAILSLDGEHAARARLWRGRARLAAGDQDGWTDLAAAMEAGGDVAPAARATAARWAVAMADSARTKVALHGLFGDERGARYASDVAVAALAAADAWGAAAALEMLAGAADARWAAPVRDSVLLVRARLAARIDTRAGIADAVALADRAVPAIAAAARLDAARWKLRTMEQPDRLEPVRALLLLIAGSPDADALIASIDAIESLREGGRRGRQPLGLFAAAEIARDELASPGLAHWLFREYAALDSSAVWAPKALLAAALIRPLPADTLARIFDAFSGNPYVAAWRGESNDTAAFDNAERRLARELAALRSNVAAQPAADTVSGRDSAAAPIGASPVPSGRIDHSTGRRSP